VKLPALPRTGAVASFARAVIAATRDLEPDRALRLGAALGRSWVRAGGPRVDVARTNLELCFPEHDAGWRREVAVASFENLGRCLAEVVLLHGRHRDALLERVRLEGAEHIEAARARSEHGGAFVLTAHFGSWELGGAMLSSRGLPITSVHRARGDEQLDELVASWRQDSGQEVVALGMAGVGALRALRRGRLVMMLIDQNARRDEGVFAPFFDIPASTRSGPARLAARLGVPVLPAFMHRLGASGEHVARFHRPLELLPEPQDDDSAAKVLAHNVETMNRAVENAVRADPAQWMWAHRRFRTRPPGEPRLYPDRRGVWRRLRHAVRGRS
jgi:KDO2-lipid IV(A) lauroyltransferase